MCILFLSINQHPEFPLIILANRDEFQERPTSKAHFWKNNTDLLAGKDEQEGGTWLGISKKSRISALTNYRNIPLHKEGRLSRGFLVRDYLLSTSTPEEYLNFLEINKENYNPYNILIGDFENLYVYNNVSNIKEKLEPGFHGLSNAFLNSPWPKLCKGVENLKNHIKNNSINSDELFTIMKDESKAPDEFLPDTGVGLEKERFLSSIFIKSEVYGTRSTAIILINKNGKVTFEERTYDKYSNVTNQSKFEF